MTKQIIIDFLKTHKDEFREKYDVKKIGLFGSYARDEAKEDSDIDIYVDMKPSFDNIMNLKYTIEESLHKPVDILTKHKNMRPFLVNMIDKDVYYV